MNYQFFWRMSICTQDNAYGFRMAHLHIVPALFRRTLNNIFRNGWLGMGRTVEFLRSPDLTPLDFFLWGYLKNIIYQVEPTTPENMKCHIMETLQQLGTATLQRVENSFQNQLNLCIEANGQAFEHLLA